MSTARYDIHRVRVTAKDAETLRTLLREVRPDVGGRARQGEDGSFTIDAYVPAERIASLSREGVEAIDAGSATEAGRTAQADVGRGDRFAPEAAYPRGLAAKVRD
ncbi:hypothetical protein ACFVVX_28530 [Kitasatospora sp. NPDC058170]|uniref:hypothetical protein n=1 Tax=Kitasatospora sp. NPDC058170 TaxID=3346364 RepID=UPI0036DE9E2E